MVFSRCIWVLGVFLIWGGAVLCGSDIRVGLLGPSRENPHWQFFKRGLAEAAEDSKRQIEWIDVTGWKATPPEQQRAAARLKGVTLDAVIVWPLEVDALAEARVGWIVNETPVYTLERPLPPGESIGHIEVNATELSSAIHIVAVDLSPRTSGVLLYFQPVQDEEVGVFAQPWKALLEAHPAWPATGAWSWANASTPELARHRMGAMVTSELRLVQQSGGFPEGSRYLPKVALAMDSFAFSQLADGQVDALVVPHYAEAGRWVLERLSSGEEEGERQSRDYFVRPLIVTERNQVGWLSWWQKWEH